MQDVILQYTYPRIDLEVSKHLNHLLKAPFCIHPATGKVCVPLEGIEQVESFNPDRVPSVGQLLAELDKNPGAGWEATSLKPFVDIMDRHAAALVRETRDKKKSEPKSCVRLSGRWLMSMSRAQHHFDGVLGLCGRRFGLYLYYLQFEKSPSKGGGALVIWLLRSGQGCGSLIS